MSGEYPHLANSVLKSENITTQKEIVDKIEHIRTEAKRRTSTTHRGVSSFIEDMHRLSDDPAAPLRRLVPHFDEENYIAREVALNKEMGKDVRDSDLLRGNKNLNNENFKKSTKAAQAIFKKIR